MLELLHNILVCLSTVSVNLKYAQSERTARRDAYLTEMNGETGISYLSNLYAFL